MFHYILAEGKLSQFPIKVQGKTRPLLILSCAIPLPPSMQNNGLINSSMPYTLQRLGGFKIQRSSQNANDDYRSNLSSSLCMKFIPQCMIQTSDDDQACNNTTSSSVRQCYLQSIIESVMVLPAFRSESVIPRV